MMSSLKDRREFPRREYNVRRPRGLVAAIAGCVALACLAPAIAFVITGHWMTGILTLMQLRIASDVVVALVEDRRGP